MAPKSKMGELPMRCSVENGGTNFGEEVEPATAILSLSIETLRERHIV
jgi:hypothetical protein